LRVEGCTLCGVPFRLTSGFFKRDRSCRHSGYLHVVAAPAPKADEGWKRCWRWPACERMTRTVGTKKSKKRDLHSGLSFGSKKIKGIPYKVQHYVPRDYFILTVLARVPETTEGSKITAGTGAGATRGKWTARRGPKRMAERHKTFERGGFATRRQNKCTGGILRVGKLPH